MICGDEGERNLVRHGQSIEEEKIRPYQQAETPQWWKAADDIGTDEQTRWVKMRFSQESA